MRNKERSPDPQFISPAEQAALAEIERLLDEPDTGPELARRLGVHPSDVERIEAIAMKKLRRLARKAGLSASEVRS